LNFAGIGRNSTSR